MANSRDQPADQRSVVIKGYRGSVETAMDLFEEDAVKMVGNGYFPTAQSWVPVNWGVGLFVLAILLSFIGIGVFVFLYMIIYKPDGALTVTYQHVWTVS